MRLLPGYVRCIVVVLSLWCGRTVAAQSARADSIVWVEHRDNELSGYAADGDKFSRTIGLDGGWKYLSSDHFITTFLDGGKPDVHVNKDGAGKVISLTLALSPAAKDAVCDAGPRKQGDINGICVRSASSHWIGVRAFLHSERRFAIPMSAAKRMPDSRGGEVLVYDYETRVGANGGVKYPSGGANGGEEDVRIVLIPAGAHYVDTGNRVLTNTGCGRYDQQAYHDRDGRVTAVELRVKAQDSRVADHPECNGTNAMEVAFRVRIELPVK